MLETIKIGVQDGYYKIRFIDYEESVFKVLDNFVYPVDIDDPNFKIIDQPIIVNPDKILDIVRLTEREAHIHFDMLKKSETCSHINAAIRLHETIKEASELGIIKQQVVEEPKQEKRDPKPRLLEAKEEEPLQPPVEPPMFKAGIIAPQPVDASKVDNDGRIITLE